MPNRLLRESILTSRAVNKLSRDAEVFYRRLMSVVDDYGRFVADEDILLARLYPLQLSQTTAAECAQLLAECGQALTTDGEPLVSVYAVGNNKYLQINNFAQRTRSRSKFPEKPARGCQRMTADARLDGGVVEDGDGDEDVVGRGRSRVCQPHEGIITDEAKKWFVKEYPLNVFEHDIRLLISIIETPEDLQLLRDNLPLWKATDQWSRGMVPKCENFLSKRIWQQAPKVAVPGDDEW